MFLERFIRFSSRFSKFLLTTGHIFNQVYDLFLPPICLLCSCLTQSSQNICAECFKDLPILSHHCPQCAQFLHRSALTVCGACLKKPPPFDLTYALFPYQPPVIQLITALKFRGQLSHANLLGELLAQKIQFEWYKHKPLPDLIIPVPLHSQRLRERGFNQSLEIARPIAKLLAIPIDIDGVKRCRTTHPQSGLTATERKHNVANAFAVTKDYSHLTVALIDDVITTGHTITEICTQLKQKNTKNIHIWCCARRDVALNVKNL